MEKRRAREGEEVWSIQDDTQARLDGVSVYGMWPMERFITIPVHADTYTQSETTYKNMPLLACSWILLLQNCYYYSISDSTWAEYESATSTTALRCITVV